MSADRETNHDMTDRTLALLLADAADEVEIGIAPTQALIRGGRRRRARRWAVAAATALVVAGSTGALAVTGLPGGNDHRTAPPTTAAPAVLQPDAGILATGTDQGRDWRVTLDVWPAPRDEAQALAMLSAMKEYGETPRDATVAADLVGKSAFFVRRGVGDDASGPIVWQGLTTKADRLSGRDMEAIAIPLVPGTDGPNRLVVGNVAKTARQVTCYWQNGTSTDVHREPSDGDVNSDQLVIRTVEKSLHNWFVCLGPKDTTFKSTDVTK